jgi:hypothetical protein
MKIQGYKLDDASEENITIRDSAGAEINSADPISILDFLLTPYPCTMKAVWDLDAFFAPVLRLLGLEVCREIERTHEATFGQDDSGVTYKVFYIQDKKLSIEKTTGRNLPKLRATYYGLCGFFDDDVKEPLSASSLEELGNKLLTELEKIGISPTKLTSPIGAFMSTRKLPSLPTISNTPEAFTEAQFYADKCTGREWRENFKTGHWSDDECYLFDRSCAYGSEAARLPDLRFAEYIYSREMVDKAWFGFLRGIVSINDNIKVSPIMTRLADGRMVNPTGSWETYLTLDEIVFIERYSLGSFKLKDGWFLKFKHVERPLQLLMETLYRQRTLSDPLLNTFLKRVPSGIVGMFHQHFDDSELGDYFNPIYHAIVTSTNRLKVAEIIFENNAENNIIRVNTDGLLVDKPLWIAKGTGLGKWRLLQPQATIVLSPELVLAGDKHPNGIYYPKLRAMICRHPKSILYMDNTVKKRVTLFEAVRDNNLQNLGKMTTRSARIDLTMLAQAQIRNFPKFPRTGEQLIENKYTSSPIRIGKNS